MSARKFGSWKRRQVKKVQASAKGRSRRYRMLRGNNTAQTSSVCQKAITLPEDTCVNIHEESDTLDNMVQQPEDQFCLRLRNSLMIMIS